MVPVTHTRIIVIVSHSHSHSHTSPIRSRPRASSALAESIFMPHPRPRIAPVADPITASITTTPSRVARFAFPSSACILSHHSLPRISISISISILIFGPCLASIFALPFSRAPL
ncbi:hypothetical protein HETIRDRAFT_453649 [Heterobasidion irregulare TC 32-1]|uniref:Uncharacterized protein n=1 Tax=Heterobasidion irregulare (strain TC 32-1) TaxID=747525 RepID=W4K0B7_HETIT|nr:uncharacterized protein HETIRDRAFT_453649 [Heterobasidion irregulare TC 32-1]ETW79174.1 hypothetical protein HETIRDRAFT_453649 [Heterobasidion irregulare TC 32-1]